MATAASPRVEPWQRFTKRTQDCPICGGNQDDRRHRGIRCWGYVSKDERYAHCTEIAGDLQQRSDGTYKHLIDGSCWCNGPHETTQARPMPARKPEREVTVPRWQQGPFPKEKDGATLAAYYVYRHRDNTPSYSVLRYEYPLQPGQAKPDKTFSQVRHQDTAAWAWGLGDTERLLYHLPDLFTAPAGRPVFIVEGEKAAEALIALGLVATTCPEGAEKWLQVPGRYDALRGRHVVILPDCDDKGRRHAQQVAADLATAAASVRIVVLPGLPEHGDAVEWLADGGTKDALYELVIATPVHISEAQPQSEQDTQQAEQAAQEQAAREAALKTANQRMNERLSWPQRVNAVPATHLRKSEAKVAIALRHLVEARRRTPPEADGYVQVTGSELALASGVSKGTASKAAQELTDMGVFRKKPFQVRDKHDVLVDCVAFELGELVDAPEQWVPPGGPREIQGGARAGAGAKPNTCRKCGGVQVQITEQDWLVTEETTFCPDCKEKTTRQVGPRRPAGPPRVIETQDSKGLPFEYSNGNGVDAQEDDTEDERDTHTQTPPRISEREQYGNGVDDQPRCDHPPRAVYRLKSGRTVCGLCNTSIESQAS